MNAETVEVLRRIWQKSVAQHERTIKALPTTSLDMKAQGAGRQTSELLLLEVSWEIRRMIEGTDEAVEGDDRLAGQITNEIRRLQAL